MTTDEGDALRRASWSKGAPGMEEEAMDAGSFRARPRSIRDGTTFRILALLFLVAVLDPRTVVSSDTTNQNITGILDSLLVDYDQRVRPNYGGPPVEVGVSMFVLNIGPISEATMDFTLDFYFRQHWTDQRLSFSWRPGMDTISVGPGFGKNIWVPDTFFANEKQSYAHSVTTSNEFFRISPSGGILKSVRITVTASCPMNLHYFPMDSQHCEISFESYGHTMRDIRYKWNDGQSSVGVANDISLPQFNIVGYRAKSADISVPSGNYSRLGCEFHFVRSIGYYIMQIYIPSALIVIISWVTFWLNRSIAPTRIALGVITVLTMTALMSSTNAYLPKVSYIKATDLYLGICFIMVFASILEYATVCYMLKRLQTKRNRYLAIQKLADERKQGTERKAGGGDGGATGQKQTEVRFKVFESKVVPSDNGTGSGRIDEEAGEPNLSGGKADKLYGVSPSDLDKYSRIVFPISFVCFNLMYWIIYLHISGTPGNDLVLLEQDR